MRPAASALLRAVCVKPAARSADAFVTPDRVRRKVSMSMLQSCPVAGGMGRSGLRHVDNPSVLGHFDTDTPWAKPGMRIPGLNVPRDGRRPAVKAGPGSVTHRLTSDSRS